MTFSEYLKHYKPNKAQLDLAIELDKGAALKFKALGFCCSGKTWLLRHFEDWCRQTYVEDHTPKE